MISQEEYKQKQNYLSEVKTDKSYYTNHKRWLYDKKMLSKIANDNDLEILELVESKDFSKIKNSEKDNVIDTRKVLALFEERFTHPNSRLLWFGKKTKSDDKRIIVLDDYLPQNRISNFSHMSVLYAPSNFHYGINANYIICDESPKSRLGVACSQSTHLWYSAFGYKEKGKLHARLTYNPWFSEMSSVINTVFNMDHLPR